MYEEILDVAEELFMKQGYNDTSTRQIAKILEITQPNIYYHFKNKEEIYFQVMQRLANEVGKNLSELSAQDISFEEKILAMAFYLQQRCDEGSGNFKSLYFKFCNCANIPISDCWGSDWISSHVRNSSDITRCSAISG